MLGEQPKQEKAVKKLGSFNCHGQQSLQQAKSSVWKFKLAVSWWAQISNVAPTVVI